MITAAFLYLIKGLLLVLAGPFLLLSDVGSDSTIVAGFTQASDSYGLLHGLIPNTVTTLLTCVSLLVIFEVAYWGYKGFMWILRKIPGIN